MFAKDELCTSEYIELISQATLPCKSQTVVTVSSHRICSTKDSCIQRDPMLNARGKYHHWPSRHEHPGTSLALASASADFISQMQSYPASHTCMLRQLPTLEGAEHALTRLSLQQHVSLNNSQMTTAPSNCIS